MPQSNPKRAAALDDAARARAAVLRAARERAGLGQRELARKIGLAQDTVRLAELGRMPRHSTLMRYLAMFPWLRASDLLRSTGAHAQAWSYSAWQVLSEAQGITADELTVTWRRAPGEGWYRQVEVRGMRAARTQAASDAVLRALLHASCVGTRRIHAGIEELDVTGRIRQWSLDEDGVHYQWRLTGRGSRQRLHHQSEGRTDADPLFEHALRGCVGALTLAVHDSGALKQLHQGGARPLSIPWDGAEPLLARRLYPTSAPVHRRGKTSWRIEHPLPGVVHALLPLAAPVRHHTRRWSLGATLREARSGVGLSLRELAARGNISWSAARFAESGRDATVRVLETYLEAVEALSPQDLLPASSREPGLTNAEAWELVRNAYGYEIAELRKTLTIRPDGESHVEIASVGLRSLRDDMRDLRIRTNLHQAVAQLPRHVLESVESEHESVRVSRVQRDTGKASHVFTFPRSVARSGLGYVRHYAGPRFRLGVPASQDPKAERVASGSETPVEHPTHRLVSTVVLPHSVHPTWARAHAWPPGPAADVDLPPLSPSLEVPPLRLRSTAEGMVLSLSVSKPHVGMRYGIVWGLD